MTLTISVYTPLASDDSPHGFLNSKAIRHNIESKLGPMQFHVERQSLSDLRNLAKGIRVDVNTNALRVSAAGRDAALTAQA